MLLLAAAPALAPAGPGAPAVATLGHLADLVAAEILRAAAGRAVVLAPIEDATGAGALAADLQTLVSVRLEGHLAGPAPAGSRIEVASVAAWSGPRLVWTGRIVDESGALVDVVSASAPWDADVLPLLRPREGAEATGFDVLEHATTPALEGRVVSLAFAGDDRLLVLFDDALALYRRDGLSLRMESRREMPGPLSPVRFPGGLLLAVEPESSCWALTSRSPRAMLVSIEGSRLVPVQQADVLPWPGTATGARFRPGTNLLDLGQPGLDRPLVAVEAGEGWAVDGAGTLSRLGGDARAVTAPRVGPAVAVLWPGVLAAASADPPGDRDRILLLGRGDGAADADTWTPSGSLAVDGGVRALAARRQARGALLAAALEDPGGAFRIALFALAERK